MRDKHASIKVIGRKQRSMSQSNFSVASHSKLKLADDRVSLASSQVQPILEQILTNCGCRFEIAEEVAAHLIDTDLCGIESHGVMRVLQYAKQFENGYLDAKADAKILHTDKGGPSVCGGGGIGIPAMRLAVDHCVSLAKTQGIAALPIRNVGHTGRLGSFAERAAMQSALVIIIGGGGRQNWRQVAPYGGRKALLPTNPYCFGIPGGAQGPVVVDFATSVIAGGWVYAAHAAGAQLPQGALITKDGKPSTDPSDYFDGGAILPKGGVMGYGLALMAELICEAMLGPVTTEVNWLVLALDTERYREAPTLQSVAEEILAEIRSCPPADGFTSVEVPGERERKHRASNPESMLAIPHQTWTAILEKAGLSEA
jgi:LDH2 family malate/lactate/ureidoglycolate dehydrogenase